MSTSFALEFWSNKIIDVDIILSITLTVSWKLKLGFITEKICVGRGANLYKFSLFQTWISAILDKIIKNRVFFAWSVRTVVETVIFKYLHSYKILLLVKFFNQEQNVLSCWGDSQQGAPGGGELNTWSHFSSESSRFVMIEESFRKPKFSDHKQKMKDNEQTPS